MDHNEEQKALFFDIDGTILSELNGTIPESAKAAIGAAVREGHLAFINTGRTLCTIPAEVRNMDFVGFLCGCGTDIICRGERIFSRDVPEAEGRPLLDLITRCNMDAVLEGRNSIYLPSKQPEYSSKGAQWLLSGRLEGRERGQSEFQASVLRLK